jgi:hypothetical protein
LFRGQQPDLQEKQRNSGFKVNFTPRFFRLAAVCALLTALTTLVVHVMPNLWSDAMSFEQQVELRLNSLYLTNRWVVLLHCALVVVSMFALGLPAIRRSPVAVIFGFLAFACFGFSEMVRTAISIFAINRNWRAAYAGTIDPATRDRFRAVIESYSGINDALFFIFYTAFTVGLICYGIAFLRTNDRMSQLGILFTVWALLNLPGWIDAVIGTDLLGRYFEWVGPAFQPVARAWIGVWLWRNARWAAASVAQSFQIGNSRRA